MAASKSQRRQIRAMRDLVQRLDGARDAGASLPAAAPGRRPMGLVPEWPFFMTVVLKATAARLRGVGNMSGTANDSANIEAGAPPPALAFDPERFVAAKAPDCRVLHFIQGKKRAVLDFLPQFPEDASLLAVIYDADLGAEEAVLFAGPVAGRREAVFWPGSTWAEGRNFAADIARRCGPAFDYAAFLDDDVAFTSGAYCDFIDQVLRHRPMIATPVTPRANQKRYALPVPRQAAALNDEQLLVFHLSALADPYVWPIVREFEHVSWHVACVIQEFFIAHRFPRQLIQFNDFRVSNDGHVWQEDDGTSIYHYEQDFGRVVETAYGYAEGRLGTAPSLANENFRRLRSRDPRALLAIAYWKYFGRESWMRNPLDRDGRPIEID